MLLESAIWSTASLYDRCVPCASHRSPPWQARNRLVPFGFCGGDGESVAGNKERSGRRRLRVAEVMKNRRLKQTAVEIGRCGGQHGHSLATFYPAGDPGLFCDRGSARRRDSVVAATCQCATNTSSHVIAFVVLINERETRRDPTSRGGTLAMRLESYRQNETTLCCELPVTF